MNIRLRVLPQILPIDGREIELQATATHIQWRYSGDEAWTDLIALSELIGPEGPATEFQVADGYIQYRTIGEGDWIDLVALTDITGPQGDEGPQGPSVTDGDKGDVIVSAAGTLWEIPTLIPAIRTDTTISVPGDFATPLAAWQYLQGFIIQSGVVVTVEIAAGDYVHTEPMTGHPQGNQVFFEGADLPTGFPTGPDFVITGNGSGERATDNSNHLSMLQTKFASRIEMDAAGGSVIDIRWGGAGPNLNNLLFFGETGHTGVGAYVYDSVSRWNNCGFHGFGGVGVVVTNGGNIRTENLTVSGCAGVGIQSSDVSDIKSTGGLISCSNESNGVFLKRMGCMEAAFAVSKGNGGSGFVVDDSGSMECPEAYSFGNASHGYMVVNGGILSCMGAEAEANSQFGFFANSKGEITATNAIATNNVDDSFVANGLGIIYAGAATVVGGQDGFAATQLAAIYAANAQVSGHTGVGFSATGGGRIDATGADVTGGTTGYLANDVAIIDAPASTVANASANGYWATIGGQISANGASATGCGSTGVYVLDDGYINFTGGVATGNNRGIYVVDGGKVNAESATISGNTVTAQAQVAAVGQIRVTGTGLTGTAVVPTLNTLGGTASQALVYT